MQGQGPIDATSTSSSDPHEFEEDETPWTPRNRFVRQRGMFADATEMKAKLHEKLAKPEYDVAMYYHKHGLAQAIARSSWFEQLTLLVIGFNAVWIFIDTDYNPTPVLANAPVGFQIVEQLFCFYFVWELLIRFLAFKKKLNGFRDAWFVADSLLTCVIVIDSWILYLLAITGGMPGGGLGDASVLRILRLLRLSRVARMARMLKAIPELLIIVRAMGAAMRAVGTILTVQLALLYIFGIAFKHLCSDVEQAMCSKYFFSVPKSAHTLLVHGFFMDSLADFVNTLEQYSIPLLLFFYFFLLLSALSVMNMLIGLFCDVVNTTATVEKEALSILYVKDKLQQIIVRGGLKEVAKGDSSINKEEFLQILGNRDAAQVLKEVGVDVVSLIDFADFIFKADDDAEHAAGEQKEISFAEFVEVVLELRGNNSAAVRDVVHLRKFVQSKVAGLEERLDVIASYTRRSVKLGTENNKLARTSSMDLSALQSTNLMDFVGVRSTPGTEFVGATSTSVSSEFSEYTPRVFQRDPDDLISPSERVVAIYRDLGKLIESLALEHQTTIATLRRCSERLQAELDVLRPFDKYKNTEGEISQQSNADSPAFDNMASVQHHVKAEAAMTSLESNSFNHGSDAGNDSNDQSRELLNTLDEYRIECDSELNISAPHPGPLQRRIGNLAVSSQMRCSPGPAERYFL